MAQHTHFVIPASRLAAVVAALTASVRPALAQQPPLPPQPTTGEASTARRNGTTRAGAPRPMPPASALKDVPKSKRDGKRPTGHRNGTPTPGDSDRGSILGTPK